MYSPKSIGLIDEKVVGISHSQEGGQESENQVLSEQSVRFEHRKFTENRKDEVLPCQLMDDGTLYEGPYMLSPLKIRALRLLFVFFS